MGNVIRQAILRYVFDRSLNNRNRSGMESGKAQLRLLARTHAIDVIGRESCLNNHFAMIWGNFQQWIARSHNTSYRKLSQVLNRATHRSRDGHAARGILGDYKALSDVANLRLGIADIFANILKKLLP